MIPCCVKLVSAVRPNYTCRMHSRTVAQPRDGTPARSVLRTAVMLAMLAVTTAQPLPVAAAGAQTLEDIERQIIDASEQLKTLDNEIASTRQRRQTLQQALEQARSGVGEREQRLAQLDAEIVRFDKQLASLDQRIAQARAQMADRRQTLVRALRQTQQIGQQRALKVVLQHDDPALADRLSVYTAHVLAAHQQAIIEQSVHLKKLQSARESALKDHNWLNYIKKKAASQRQGYAEQASASQRSLGEVEAELSRKTRTVAELRADQTRLQSLMEELEESQTSLSGYFASGKGSYPPPVVGSVHARFNEVKSVGKLRWSGLFIKADQGQPVRAIADGEVVYSQFLRGFGMLVIIDHGDGYTSLYGGNREVVVTSGQWVDSGATIATVGDSSGQNLSGLYFEIRQNAEAVDPEAWLRGELLTADNRK